MSVPTYPNPLSEADKPLVWLHGEIQSPPFSPVTRIEAGVLFRRLRQGESLGLPHSRPMPVIGRRCHELRIPDQNLDWRIFYHLAKDAVVILDIHHKTTRRTPDDVIRTCRRRLKLYLACANDPHR